MIISRFASVTLPDLLGRLRPYRWLIFGLLVLSLGYPELKRANDIVTERFAGSTDTRDWTATAVWLESAECMRRTGAWLTICRDNTLAPIANYALADDPGHALLLGIGARILDRTMTVLDAALLNNAIDFLAMVCIAALLWAAGSYVASTIFIVWGGFAYFNLLYYSPHPAITGAASFAAVLPIGLVLSRYGYLSRAAGIVFVGGGILLLGVAALLREPVGIMGLITDIGAFSYLVRHSPRRPELLKLLPLLALTLIAWQAPRLVLLARDEIFEMPAARHVQTHGISHNLYMGLGSVENSFGIRWDDKAAMDAATRADPGVSFVSDRYFRTMWKLYFDRLNENPREVARIYTVKAGRMLSLRLPDDGWAPVWAEWALSGLLLIAGLLLGLWRRLNYGQAPIVLSVGMVFAAFFVLQGVLADVSIVYAYPIGVFVLLFVAIRGEALVRCAPWLMRRFGMRPVEQ